MGANIGLAIWAMGSPDVLVVRIAPGARCSATFSRSLCLIEMFSATASITQSHVASFGMSSSKFPGVMRSAKAAS